MQRHLPLIVLLASTVALLIDDRRLRYRVRALCTERNELRAGKELLHETFQRGREFGQREASATELHLVDAG